MEPDLGRLFSSLPTSKGLVVSDGQIPEEVCPVLTTCQQRERGSSQPRGTCFRVEKALWEWAPGSVLGRGERG